MSNGAYYLGSALIGRTMFNIGSAPADPSIIQDDRWRRHAYHLQTYKLCADEALRGVPRGVRRRSSSQKWALGSAPARRLSRSGMAAG